MTTRLRKNISVKDFVLDTTKANVSEITLTGRYPEKGKALNMKSEMLVYIVKGKVILTQSNKKKNLTKGSMVLVKTKEPYIWTPTPRVTMLIFSTPPWTSEEQKII